MNKRSALIVSEHGTGRGTFKSYATGYVLSIVLTFIPFIIVTTHALHGSALIIVLVASAVAQLMVQLQFFIHLGHESKPRWNALIFLFMLLVLLIVVIGSLRIMKNLDYNMMSPRETDNYIRHEEAIDN